MDHAEFTARRSLPMMALRGLTVFPGMMLTFEVERSMSIAALNMAMSDDQIIYLVPQKDIATDIPTPDDVYGVGTVCRIKQMMKQPGTKTIRVMAEGIERGRTLAMRTDMPCFVAEVEPMPDVEERKTARTEALIRHCCNLFDAYVTASGNMAPESVISVLGSTNAAFVSNFISQHVFLRPEEKQELLEETRPSRRLSKLSKMLLHETTVLGLQHQLEEAAQDRLNQTQQEYLLREQMKIIQAELGESDDPDSESADYREKILALHLPADSEQRLLKEVDRLKKQPFGSSEAAVIRNYLDICLELPWNTRTKETLDVRAAREVLDKEHFGLEKVKDRITEYLAVRQLAPDVKGGVLCLVGPPGTGKTSIAMSIAHATNRKLARISLGGVHDEAEIRGHRKTYVGAMPGRIINGLTIAGSMNPVMVLDEIDKLGSDYRGDPSSALLEVLDAEQNDHFRDNFMEIPVDLSDVFFILTANTLDTIPRPLLDRMDLQVSVPSVEFEAIRRREKAEPSAAVRERVNAARDIQKKRFAGTPITCNAYMTAPMVGEFCRLDAAGEKLLKGAFDRLGLTARSHDKLLRVARTIADLDGSERIESFHLAEAIQYRNTDILRGEG